MFFMPWVRSSHGQKPIYEAPHPVKAKLSLWTRAEAWSKLGVVGETEAGSAGEQPAKG